MRYRFALVKVRRCKKTIRLTDPIRSLPFAALYCSLLTLTALYSPLLPLTCPLLPFAAFYCLLLPITAPCLPFTALCLPYTALFPSEFLGHETN